MNLINWLEENLKKTDLNYSAEEYFSKTVKYALFVSLAVWFLVVLFLNELFSGLVFAGAIFLVCSGIAFYYPFSKKKQLAALIEAELPFALMELNAELKLGISFEECLENFSKEKNLLSKEFKRILADVDESGASIPEALMNFSERIDSEMVKRAINQLIVVYDSGGKPVGLKELAREQLLRQRAESKEFTGKLVVYSLIFIAFSAIIPALLQTLISVGGMFMKLNITPLQILLLTAVGFPLIDALILAYIKAKTPVFMR